MRLSFIGGGAMAEAMIGGILTKGVAGREDIVIGEPVAERRTSLEERHGVRATPSNTEAAQAADILVLSVKPQNLSEVLKELDGSLRPQQAVLSIIAGARMSTIVDGLRHQSVIRVMPNTPAQVGAGISVWTCAPEVSEGQQEAARAMLKTMGEEVLVTDEKYLDMATAVSASGPAYVFTFIESLIDGGVHVGLPREMATTLAVQTVLGSAKLAGESGRHPAELRNIVTSPGGTTAQALLALEEGGFRAAVLNAVIAAYKRSVELGA